VKKDLVSPLGRSGNPGRITMMIPINAAGPFGICCPRGSRSKIARHPDNKMGDHFFHLLFISRGSSNIFLFADYFLSVFLSSSSVSFVISVKSFFR
jgi:hypothetical protein